MWDAESELTSVKTATSTTASFVYDANGDRLTRSDSTGTTVYLPGGQEILVTSTGVKSATRYYTFDGQTVAVRTKNGLGGVTSLVNDPHGTTLAAVPNTTWTKTSVIKRYTTPFGALRGSSDAVPGDRQFLNKVKDATGLTMIGARYYDDAHGRFLSVDPIMDLTDPQQWNGYAYSNNNPTTWSDPTGLIINMPRPDTDVYANPPSAPVYSPPAPHEPTPSPVPAPHPCPCAPGNDDGPSAGEVGHVLVDVVGVIPGAEFADGANAIWYAAERDWVNAGLSAAGMIPFAGWIATGIKWVRNGAKAAEATAGVTKIATDIRPPLSISPKQFGTKW